MKKLLLIVALGLFCSTAQADIRVADITNKLPPLTQGIGFSMDDHEITYLSTLQIIEYKGFALNGGYSTKDNLIVALSYELTNLEKLGVTVPILKHIKIQPIVYGGFGSINTRDVSESESSWGFGINILDIKF